jgi:hypothetical protein
MKGVINVAEPLNISVANEKTVIDSTSSSSAMVKEAFSTWLTDGNAKKYSPTIYLNCMDKVSGYLIRRKISCFDLWQYTNIELFKKIYNKAINDGLFRATDKRTHTVFVDVGQDFMKFLKSKPTLFKISKQSREINPQINRQLTIKDAVIRVLETSERGMTVEKIYKKIIADGLYSFDVQNPQDVVRVEIDCACVNSNYTIRASKDCFRFERNSKGEKIYFLLPSSPSISNDKSEITIDSEPTESVAFKGSQTKTLPLRVDFNCPELCAKTHPVACTINGQAIILEKQNWAHLLVAITERFIAEKNSDLSILDKKPIHGNKVLFMHEKSEFGNCSLLSNGKWLYTNFNPRAIVIIIANLCRFCGVVLDNVDITYVPKTTGESGGKTMAKLEYDSARFVQQPVRDDFRLWLTEHNPEWSNGTVTMHCSDAYFLFNNERGITLEEALTTKDGLQRAYDAIERHFVNNPTQTNNPSGSARGYLRSLRMLKEFLDEKFPELINKDSITAASTTIIPDSLIEVLAQNYASGFRFDTTTLLLLGAASGVEIDERIKAALKRKMFCRDDEIYFLLDTVADASTRNDIVEFADACLREYGCFEIPEVYKLYEDRVNPKCIRSAEDFESFYEQIGNSGVRCVAAPQIGNRIARFSNGNVWGILKEVSAKIVAAIADEFYGSVNEDDLHSKFCAFSTDLLAKIIKNCAGDELVRVEINDSICYQTFDAFGLPEDFPGVLSETLEKLEDIGLEPSQDVLNTAISLKMGVNFLSEFNLPDWDTYRRLITVFYKAEPRREWRRNIFGEVTD